MHFSTSFVALIAALSQTTIAAGVNSVAAECGALGVMKIPEVLPKGIAPSDVRKCAEHPMDASLNGTSPSGAHGTLEARSGDACVLDAPYGCTGGFCWKVCGSGGEWCWTAGGGGFGPWATCNTFKDCGTDDSTWGCGQGCGGSCGCSC